MTRPKPIKSDVIPIIVCVAKTCFAHSSVPQSSIISQIINNYKQHACIEHVKLRPRNNKYRLYVASCCLTFPVSVSLFLFQCILITYMDICLRPFESDMPNLERKTRVPLRGGVHPFVAQPHLPPFNSHLSSGHVQYRGQL